MVIPWLSLEPLNYIVGLLVLLQTIYTICHAPSIKIVSVSERSTLINFFLLNFFLAWCEQSSLFQYVGNLTLTSDPSYVENFFATSRLSSLGTHTLYLMGFFLGSCCLYPSLCADRPDIEKVVAWLVANNNFTSDQSAKLFFSGGGDCAESLFHPLLWIDYLFTKGVGFIPQDKAFQGTVFSPAGMADTSETPWIIIRLIRALTPTLPPLIGVGISNPPSPQTFEDLNYQGEQYWTGKMDRKIYYDGRSKRKSFWEVGQSIWWREKRSSACRR